MVSIACINLDHRTDRWAALQASCRAHGLDPAALRRHAATADRFGALGCAKSHVAALARFLVEDRAPYGLVFEDDFEFVRPWGELVERVDALGAAGIDWDVLLLMGTAVLAAPAPAAAGAGIARVLEAQSAAGYLFTRRYAARLLACFAESIEPMERLRDAVPHAALAHRLAIDQVWKPLQRRDRWFIFTPAFGRQRPGFSDIEHRHVDYDALTYGLAAGREPAVAVAGA